MEDNLDIEVKEKSKEIFTDSYAMSVGEITSMYKENELELQPDYQRFFRWSNSQKTRFIESLLLGIPIPPIFVYQKESGVWTVIDGLQRLSTILQFMEVLRVDNSVGGGNKIENLALQGTKFLPSLENRTWEGEAGLSQKLKLFFKRAKLDIKIIKYTSDVDAQYELFQRLNTGGSSLTPQEIRNALMIMENKPFYLWFESLQSNTDFQDCLPLTNRQMNEKEDMEYLLRFFVYKYLSKSEEIEIKGNEDISPFLTETMMKIIKNEEFDWTKEKVVFEKVFKLLNDALGEESFKKYNVEKQKHTGAVSIAQFEAIVPGLSMYVEQSLDDKEVKFNEELLISKVQNLPMNEEYEDKKNQYRPILRMRELIKFSEEYINGFNETPK